MRRDANTNPIPAPTGNAPAVQIHPGVPATGVSSSRPDWPALMRPETLASYLDVSAATVARWRADGRLPEPEVVEHGADGRPRMVAWRREAIDAWLRAGRPSPAAARPSSRAGARRGRARR